MLEIKITGDTPLEALAALTAFGMRCMKDEDVYSAANRIYDAESVKKAGQTSELHTADEPKETEQKGEDLSGVRLPADTGAKGAAKPPKLEEVRAKGLEAAKKHGQPAVKAILESFKVPSMTALAEGDRAAFLVKLEELEGQGDGNA